MKSVISVLFALSCISPALAQCLREVKLLNPAPEEYDEFGTAVAVSGDRVIVGAETDSNDGPYSGSAYIYRFNGTNWIEEQALPISHSASYSFFGRSVAIDGNIAIVGALRYRGSWSRRGEVYIFRFNGTTWIEEQEIAASDAAEGQVFGSSVSVSGETAIVGAIWDSGGNGAAYVYKFNGTEWTEEQKLTTSAHHRRLGRSVSIDGDWLIVGADLAAFVYHFEDGNWVEVQKLTVALGGDFGASVSLNENAAIVGAPHSRSAYVFRFNGTNWEEEQIFIDTQAAYFGESVSISGDRVIVGASYYWDKAGGNIGAVYIFRFNGETWIDERQLHAYDAVDSQFFGVSVSISGNTIIVGAVGADTYTGSAYIYTPDCTFFDYNDNGFIDLDDMAYFSDCQVDYTAGCRVFDYDGDNDVDLKDFAAFTRSFSP